MCTIKLLRTKRKTVGALETRTNGDSMSYSQIQYYNDCIRSYASKLNLAIDKAFDKIERDNLLPIMEQAFKENCKVYVAVRRMTIPAKI